MSSRKNQRNTQKTNNKPNCAQTSAPDTGSDFIHPGKNLCKFAPPEKHAISCSQGETHGSDLPHYLSHFLRGSSGGLVIGLVLIAAAAWLPAGNGVANQLRDNFFEHYTQFPAGLFTLGFLVFGLSLALNAAAASFLQNFVVRPINDFLAHGAALSVGAIIIIFFTDATNLTLKGFAQLLFIEFYFSFIYFASSSFSYIGEHGQNIFTELDQKFNFSREFKYALQILAFIASLLIIAISYQGLLSLPSQHSGHQSTQHCD